MNGNRLLPAGQAPHPETSGRPLDRRTGQAEPGGKGRGGSLLARTGGALADKEAVRIAIRQLSLEELEHEKQVISRNLAILHGLFAEIRLELKYRREARG